MMTIQAITSEDKAWLEALLIENFGAPIMISRGIRYDARELPGFIAWLDGERAGALTYHLQDGAMEIMTIDSLKEGIGIGGALIQAAVAAAKGQGCHRVWLITTNDNLNALRFYQKRGFRLCALYADAVTEARKIKPQIPEIGFDGIPLRDELELEIRLIS
jgi:GNAT superfamily N-acetyltransferase